jgi:hypothetical protein
MMVEHNRLMKVKVTMTVKMMMLMMTTTMMTSFGVTADIPHHRRHRCQCRHRCTLTSETLHHRHLRLFQHFCLICASFSSAQNELVWISARRAVPNGIDW